MDANQLFQENIRLAYSFVKRYPPMQSMSREDYLQEMIIALWMSAKKFQEDGGAKFSTYGYTGMCFRRRQLFIDETRNREVNGGRKEIYNIEYIDQDPEKAESAELVRRSVDRLHGSSKLVVKEVMSGKRLRDVGESLGFSRQRAHFIYRKALGKLRRELVND